MSGDVRQVDIVVGLWVMPTCASDWLMISLIESASKDWCGGTGGLAVAAAAMAGIYSIFPCG